MKIKDKEQIFVTVSSKDEIYHVWITVDRRRDENGFSNFIVKYFSKSDLEDLQQNGPKTLPQILINAALRRCECILQDIVFEEAKLEKKRDETNA